MKSEEKNAMDMSIADPVRDELIKSNSAFRELVHQQEEKEKHRNRRGRKSRECCTIPR